MSLLTSSRPRNSARNCGKYQRGSSRPALEKSDWSQTPIFISGTPVVRNVLWGQKDIDLNEDKLVKTQTCTKDGYVQKFDIQGVVASTKRRRTCGTPSIDRSRCNVVDRTFYDAINEGNSYFCLSDAVVIHVEVDFSDLP
jgi:hypothetical protein